ncbi:TetR/AcrR family transcriptional regulator C-terminal domain-containing protein [Glycomyces xiaoerkulensis]|uniref:TetR/AcrR family transcriptional regulator C-terminal domain-containing protein n=1 Tax=Glycomyces xiaoerkulensis TaxID=2038139 RepID=UPI0018E4A506|nr:TetR/AcrR family transcriptional regulator C-terminal domain-containing protein [Glycomyces xiaoerkulensis]
MTDGHGGGDHRPGLTRQAVVEAALRLLDRVGLDALSTRRLAAEFGVKSSALYWHFRDKEELLGAMSATIQLAQDFSGPSEGEAWAEWLVRRGREHRRLLLAHRDGARLVTATSPGPEVAAQVEGELAVLVKAGFSPAAALRSVMAIGHYVTGFVLAEQGDPHDSADGPPAGAAELLEANPVFADAIAEGGDPQSEAAFEHGLHMLVNGMRPYPKPPAKALRERP